MGKEQVAEEGVKVPHYAFEVLRQHATSTWLKRRFDSALRYQMRYDSKFLSGLKFTKYTETHPERIEITIGGHNTTITTDSIAHVPSRLVAEYIKPMYREWWFETYGGPG